MSDISLRDQLAAAVARQSAHNREVAALEAAVRVEGDRSAAVRISAAYRGFRVRSHLAEAAAADHARSRRMLELLGRAPPPAPVLDLDSLLGDIRRIDLSGILASPRAFGPETPPPLPRAPPGQQATTPALRAIGGASVAGDVTGEVPDLAGSLVVFVANAGDLGAQAAPTAGSSIDDMVTALRKAGARVVVVGLANCLSTHNTGSVAGARKVFAAHPADKYVVLSAHGSGSDIAGIVHFEIQHRSARFAAIPVQDVLDWVDEAFPGGSGLHLDVCFAAAGVAGPGPLLLWHTAAGTPATGPAHALAEQRSVDFMMAGLSRAAMRC